MTATSSSELPPTFSNSWRRILVSPETERYRGSGYYCYSAVHPAHVTPYEEWAADYDFEGEF